MATGDELWIGPLEEAPTDDPPDVDEGDLASADADKARRG